MVSSFEELQVNDKEPQVAQVSFSDVGVQCIIQKYTKFAKFAGLYFAMPYDV